MNLVNGNTFADASDSWKSTSATIPEIASTLGPITGTTAICIGTTTTLSNTTLGGIWTSSAPSVATIGSTSGLVTGLSFGISTITYNAGASGIVTTVVTVNPNPASIIGTTSFCAGATVTLGTASTGGSWSSSNATIATVGSATGVVNGIAAGICRITYSFPGGCNTTKQITVNPCALGVNNGPVAVAYGLKVYPNPGKGFFCINIQSAYKEQAHVGVFDITGRMVKEFLCDTNSQIDITLEAGMYTISATSAHEKYVQKVRVE